jgi:hypothetical protein
MVAVFVVSDFPWWFVLVLAGLSLPWWAGIAALAAVVPTPGVRSICCTSRGLGDRQCADADRSAPG